MLLILAYSILAILLSVVVTSYIVITYGAKRRVILPVKNKNSSEQKQIVYEKLKQAPGPRPFPIIGNLHLLDRYRDNPFAGFTELSKQYGDIYSLTFGHTRCLVVNNLELIREVLNQNGKVMSGRPDFIRYHKLFGGERSNSLALCDWSQLQQKRRNLARRHCSPREYSSFYMKMSQIGCEEMELWNRELRNQLVPGEPIELKPLILKACGNMFSQYMCSLRFDYGDMEFQQIVQYFDEIFWEINQGHPLDFLPWLYPIYQRHLNKIINWSSTIRKFIMERIICHRELNIDLDEPDRDFTDALLKSLIEDKDVSRNTIIFMLEDFIGGHSAVGNLVMLVLAYIARNQDIEERIQEEIDAISSKENRQVTLMDMNDMPFTMATIFEVLRYSSSPIVPHVATEDTVISGYGVTKGTIVFINNYVLNTSENNWVNPKEFNPLRFLEKPNQERPNNFKGSDYDIENNKAKLQLRKNIPYFLPFSIGKRTCIGQNLVRGFGFLILVNIMQRYNISSHDLSTIKISPESLALPANCFSLVLTPRKNI
ncbi:cytochrome P450 307a1 [Drosophila subpulchrella]|uniref:cytochrome P450 307a1 n=1 Tax=Drosophila subpulchrella TaxID=1486046 RepID=UPI0018A12DDE|nr:cytochrome P450 307a1 [Drosophila subpulchrella]